MEFAISWPKMVRLPRNKNQLYRLDSKPQMWPSKRILAGTLTLNFHCQIWSALYISQKWSNCHETKSKHIDWTLILKYYHYTWPLAMPLTMNFQAQIWNLLSQPKIVLLLQNKKYAYRINCRPQWSSSLTLAMTLKVRCKDLPDSDRGDFRCRRAADPSSFVKPPMWHSYIFLRRMISRYH